MHIFRALVVCLLVTVTAPSSANSITDAVKATQESVVQACDNIIASELGIACVHTWENFQTWIAQRPLQAGVAAGVVAFITCYWLSKRAAQYRSMREKTEAYDDGFQDGYSYAYQSHRRTSIWA